MFHRYGEIIAKNRLMQMTMLDLWLADDISLSTIKDGYNQQLNLGLAVLELGRNLRMQFDSKIGCHLNHLKKENFESSIVIL